MLRSAAKTQLAMRSSTVSEGPPKLLARQELRRPAFFYYYCFLFLKEEKRKLQGAEEQRPMPSRNHFFCIFQEAEA